MNVKELILIILGISIGLLIFWYKSRTNISKNISSLKKQVTHFDINKYSGYTNYQ